MSLFNSKVESKVKLTMNPIAKSLISVIKEQHQKEAEKNIWKESPWKEIRELENNNVGIVGEQFVQKLCDMSGISASIDGALTKETGGGEGDGIIRGKSVEIKCARAGTGKQISFQHELGEKPWKADYMIFVDIAPLCFYITIFPNFTEEQYRSCCKCAPYFPTRSFCHRKKSGAFKFDTSPRLNEMCSNTLKWTENTSVEEIFKHFNRCITTV